MTYDVQFNDDLGPEKDLSMHAMAPGSFSPEIIINQPKLVLFKQSDIRKYFFES